MIELDRRQVTDAVAKCHKGISSRPGIPALTGILVSDGGYGTVTLSSTDLECSVSVRIDGRGKAFVEPFLVPAKPLSDALKSCHGDTVTLTVADERVQVGGASLRLLPAEDFPGLQHPEAEVARLDAQTFADTVKRILPAVSTDYARPVLTGMLVEYDGTLSLTATDSYRLHTSDEGESLIGWKSIVPGRALRTVAGWVGRKDTDRLTLYADETQVTMSYGAWSLTSRVIEGDFPNYRQLIPERDPNGSSVSYGPDLVETLKAAARFAGSNVSPVKMTLAPGETPLLTVDSPDLGRFAQTSEGTYVGEPGTYAFNATYLHDAVKAAGDTGTIELRDGLRPLVIRGAVTALVMPFRLPAEYGAVDRRETA